MNELQEKIDNLIKEKMQLYIQIDEIRAEEMQLMKEMEKLK